MSSFQIWCLLQMSKKLARGQQRAKKAKHFEKIQLGEHLATNYVHWHQVTGLAKSGLILDKQSLSDVGSSICERVHKILWNTFKITFHNVKLQRHGKYYHLQCITSSKDSEKLDKSLCVKDTAGDLCWMPVVFWLSDDTASLIGMILSLTLLNGPRNTSRNHCWETHSAVTSAYAN